MEYKFDQIAFNITAKKLPEESDRQHYIGLEHLDTNSLFVSRWGSDVTPVGEKLLMKKGDVLFGKRRAYQRKVGIAPFDGIFSAHGMVLRPKENVMDKDFFPFFISSDQFMERAVRISVGGLSPTINWKDLKEQVFEIPSLEEQKALAAKLWAAYKLREDYKRLLTATDEMVKSRFIELFGNKPSVSIQSIAKEVFAGGDKPSDISNVKTEEYKYPVFSNGIGENALLCYSKSFRVSVPAITVSARGTIGYAEIRNAHFTPVVRLLTLIPKENNNLTFVKYALNQIEYRTSGSSIGQLPVPEFIKLTVPAASITEQDRFSSIAEQADKSKFELKQAIEKIDKVMRSLLQ